jgi:hypothetical protein
MRSATRATLVVRCTISVFAATALSSSSACQKCKDEPDAYDYPITPEQFRPGSVAAGNATSYAQWRDELASEPCAQACGQLIAAYPITVTSCSTSQPDGGSSPLVIQCAWTVHACDPNPGCSG